MKGDSLGTAEKPMTFNNDPLYRPRVGAVRKGRLLIADPMYQHPADTTRKSLSVDTTIDYLCRKIKFGKLIKFTWSRQSGTT